MGTLVAGWALAGCESDRVSIDAPEVDAATEETCRTLLQALPDVVNDQLRRPTDPDDALGAAWGDPAIVLTCGVDKPTDQDMFASCTEVNGMGWWAPDDQIADSRIPLSMVTVGTEPLVMVSIPADYRPEGAATTMVELARPLKKALTTTKPCR